MPENNGATAQTFSPHGVSMVVHGFEGQYMPRFTVRVELHHPAETSYESLHDAMQVRGFSRTIMGADGKTYRLPPAEYRIRGDYTCTEVRQSAAAAAATVDHSYPVFVTVGDECCWEGLSAI
jgi:hypothetical protein